MAKGQKDKQPPKVAEDEEPEESGPSSPAEDSSLVTQSERTGAADAKDAEASHADESNEAEEAEDEEVAAAQLGSERYVLAGFFAAGMLLAYLLGKVVHGVWATLANKDKKKNLETKKRK